MGMWSGAVHTGALPEVRVLLEAKNTPQQHEANDCSDDGVLHPPHNLNRPCKAPYNILLHCVFCAQ